MIMDAPSARASISRLGVSLALLCCFSLVPKKVEATSAPSTFTGNVAASCSFVDLDNEIAFVFQPTNSLLASLTFYVNANISPIRLSLSEITVNEEPPNIISGSKPYTILKDPARNNLDLTQTAYKGSEGPPVQELINTLNQNTAVNMTTAVVTNDADNGRYKLNRGDYSYSVTITCLEGL